MAETLAITDAQFEEEVIRSRLPVVVDFWAPWCGPCRTIAPTIEALSKEWEGEIRFVKINVDEHTAQASRHGVQGIPTLLFFKDGRPVDIAVGPYPEPMLREKIRQAFGIGAPQKQS